MMMETLQQEHENLPCIKDNLFIDTVKESVKISRSNNEILQNIGKWIMKFDLDMIDKLSRKFSPRKMTPVGKLFYEESYGKQVLENNIDFFIEELNKENPKTAYDVEEKALVFYL